jgi:diguanylate cyclase (GGDEF)-like protein
VVSQIFDRIFPDPSEAQSDQRLLARITGTLFLCGAGLVAMSLALPHPASLDERGLAVVIPLAGLTGVFLMWFPRRLPSWVLHGAIGFGSLLICICVYYAGVASAIFPAMFVWVVLISAYFFGGRGVAAHLVWLLGVYAVVLAIAPSNGAGGFSPLTRWLVSALVLAVAAIVTSWLVSGLRRQIAVRETLEGELRHLALHDPLTGLANRRLVEEVIGREIARVQRHPTPLCIAAVDLDAFKLYNDTNGHAAGDDLLRGAADAWRNALRTGDLIGRFGGDEFVVVLPDCPLDEGRLVIERLRTRCPSSATCSAGLAEAEAEDTVETLLARADGALYEAKRAGRNSLVAVSA